MKKQQITVTISYVPHPKPERLIQAWARLVVKELEQLEQQASPS